MRRAERRPRRGGVVRTTIAAVAALGVAALGLGYCSDQFGFNESEEGRGVSSRLVFPASELETTLGLIAVQNDVELRVTHDVEILGRTQDIYTDIFPAQVPGLLEFRVEDLPDVEVSDDNQVKVTIPRDNVFVQERVEQLREPVEFKVEDGRIAEAGGLPIEEGTRVFLEDGTYSTGAFVFDPEQSESILTKAVDGMTLGLTNINTGTAENVLKIGQLATLNPACIRLAAERVGLDQLLAGGIQDHLLRKGFRAGDIDIQFTGEFPAYDEFPDETGATFDEARRRVEAGLAGENQKTVQFSTDCDSDSIAEPDSTVSISAAAP
ncbi:MAG TPA: hypothetical protein VKD21_14795 [Acidimicrobiales bacterium]|nr:hypothetical protein [Acidimicrobiales bacterium]